MILGYDPHSFKSLLLDAAILAQIQPKDPREMTLAEEIELKRGRTGMDTYLRRYDLGRKAN